MQHQTKKSLKERIAEMTPEELHQAMRATAEWEKRLRQEGKLFDPDDRDETIAIAEETVDILAEID